jgi:hypothetical protein
MTQSAVSPGVCRIKQATRRDISVIEGYIA